MKQSIRRLTIAGALGALALPALAGAQRPEPSPLPQADATRIINLRRVLDLTPRQLTQLDSIERSVVAARRAQAEQMRARRDSMGPMRMQAQGQPGARRQVMTPENREAMRDSARARMEAMRPQMEQMRRRDSASRAAAEGVLNEAQRQRLRELQAEERGRQRGMREARVRGAQGARGRGGVRAPQGARAPRGGMRAPQGARTPMRVRPQGDARRAP